MSGLELLSRHPQNPILTAADWPYPVNAVFNPAAAEVGGTTVLIARVEDRRGISHLSVARSANGIDDWTIASDPLLASDGSTASELWGFEDARTVWVDELGRWVITCTAYGPAGPAVFLATTDDFTTIERKGVISSEDKNAALLPLRVDGSWVLFHRPTTLVSAGYGEILVSRSTDLVSWSAPELVLQPRKGAWWDSVRVGLGPPPLRTEHGWLLVYHGVKETVAGVVYRVGLALLDLDEPTRVVRRLPTWILSPVADYERTGDVPNVVFPCGLIHNAGSNEIRVYYGAADSSICVATAQLDELIEALLDAPAEE